MWSLFCYSVPCVHLVCSHLDGEERGGCSSWCPVTVSVLLLFLAMPWVGVQCVIVAFPDHTHLFLGIWPVTSKLKNL